MKRHGLRPGHGWGELAGVYYGMEVGAAQLGVQTKLEGLFVQPCWPSGSYPYNGTVMPISRFDTRHYADDFTYELDRTYYIGDPNCVPSLSDVFYKLNLHGLVSYHGPNLLIPNATLAAMQWNSTTIYVANTYFGLSLVQQLKTGCKCNNTVWATNTWITVNAADCSTPPPSSVDLCQIISGRSDYFSYQWVDAYHYITSPDDYTQATGWARPLDPNYIREQIPESGNSDPATCDYVLWYQCGAGILDAAINCAGCVGLECDGCLFRELNPNWNPRTNVNNWHQCCPCIFYYAQQYEQDWMQVMC